MKILEITSKDITASQKRITGHGVGTIKAPRGTVFHDYHCDETGRLTKVNLIIATGHNNWAMSKAVDMVAKEFVDGKNLKEGMLNRVEASIRCYDPCLSCSTHAIGKMPIVIELVDCEGKVVDRLQRD